ncbi:MAG: WD40 repeat domain-containing protein [Alistipes sp.]|nr:WD40 repeat domain-containing protein [Alistipes sp.]
MVTKRILIVSKLFLIAFILLGCNFTVVAQDEVSTSDNKYVLAQKHSPIGFDNYQWATYYYNGKYTYNIRGYIASETFGNVEFLKVNPSGTSFALLTKKQEKSNVSIYDLWKAEHKVGEIKKVNDASAIVYTPDARKLVVATPAGILIYDAQTYAAIERIASPITARQMVVSPNNYYLAATDGNRLIIWNMESKSVRKEVELNVKVNDIAFSNDSKLFAVLTDDGELAIYDTQDFLINNTYDAMGEAIDCEFHPDGKYIAVVCSDKRIALVNMMDNTDRNYIDEELGGMNDIHFVKDNNEQMFLLYNTTDALVYRRITELAPNYTKLLSDELALMMNEWMKQMPDESLEEYKLRVNDNTRIEQMRVYEQEIATRLADNLVMMSEITLGNYNLESNMLSVNFDNMPTIFLEVPSADINGFMNVADLEFNNMKYGLTNEDKFELIYVDIRNKTTGKIYTYNNLARRSLEYLKMDEAFVPLEVIQQSNLQEMKLQEIKETIVSMAKEQNTISDHTNITVKADVESSTNADGKRIMNYVTNFSYTVKKEFSAQEDFAPGKYKTEGSGAAKSMMQIIKQALEGEFAQYVKEGKKLLVKITGMADAMPINGTIAYDGCYGEYVGEPVYKNNVLGNITLTKANGIKENEQLAFVRALGVKDYLTKNIVGISTMDTDYNYNIEVTAGKGGEFRRITVQLIFVDAF